MTLDRMIDEFVKLQSRTLVHFVVLHDGCSSNDNKPGF